MADWKESLANARKGQALLEQSLAELQQLRDAATAQIVQYLSPRTETGVELDIDAIQATLTRPYTLIPAGENEATLIHWRGVRLPIFGWVIKQERAFTIARVARGMDLLTPLPGWMKDEMGWRPPEHKALIDGTRTSVRVTDGDEQAFRKKYGAHLGAKTADGFKIRGGDAWIKLVASLVRDGILPYVPRPVAKEDWDAGAKEQLKEAEEDGMTQIKQALQKVGQDKPGMTRSRLADLEGCIEEGLQSFMDVGYALAEIRDKRGYLLKGCSTFDDYCTKVWGFTERQGLRLMDGYQTAQKVKEITGETPRNEYAARVLKPVASDPKLVTKVAEKLKKEGATIASATAEEIAKVVDKVLPKTMPMFPEPSPVHSRPSTGAPKDEQAAEAKEREAAMLSDVCPGCHNSPSAYRLVNGTGGKVRVPANTWECADCHTLVSIGLVVRNVDLPAKKCPQCGVSVSVGQPYCVKCGSVL